MTDALVLATEIRLDNMGNGRRASSAPAVTILAFDDEGVGSRATLAALAGLPGLIAPRTHSPEETA